MTQRKSADLKLVSGTDQPSRRRERVVDELPAPAGGIKPPTWLKRLGRRLFLQYVELFEARGQNIAGSENALAHFCALEAGIIENYHKKALMPPAAMMRSYTTLAGQFHLTPESQSAPAGGKAKNRFARNGKPPA